VADLVSMAVDRLRRAGIELASGLSDAEFARIDEVHGFEFGTEHRELLSAVLPVGKSWPDWRSDPRSQLQAQLDWPVDGVVFDVLSNSFWPASWGPKPPDAAAAEQLARDRLARVPRLVPVYAHRCLPAAPAPVPSPVFSVHQTDVIYYGNNLLDYVAREFLLPPGQPLEKVPRPYIEFWSDLAEGAEDADL
jgi:hypothetical protein